VAWLADAIPGLLIFGPVPLLLLLFPTGRLLSRAWRPVAWAAPAALTINAAASTLFPRHLNGNPLLPNNPTGLPSCEDTLDSVTSLCLLLFAVLLLVSLYGVGVRLNGLAAWSVSN
jgi:hypothetical protein